MALRKNLIFTLLALLFLFNSSFQGKDIPYVILVSFDAFRWDYTSRGLTPNLDMMKKNGVSALSLRPSFPSKTFPNHLSIITGMYPENHGIIHNEFTDPFSGKEYAISDSSAVREGRWYTGEAFWETAGRQGILTASYFWPGSEVSLSYRHPTYFEKYEHKRDYIKRIDGVIEWLKLPYKERPHFITIYFDATDSYGHRYGPNSPQVNSAIKLEDSLVGVLISRLRDINMKDSVNLIVLSDHGMTETSSSRIVNVEKLTGLKLNSSGSGPVMMIEPSENERENVFSRLKEKENHYRVYKREEMPEYYHFAHNPLIYSIVLIAEPGWSLTDNKSEKSYSKYASGGNHGYDNNFTDMHGIFFAEGPAFKKNYQTGTLWNVDIYLLLCRIFNIMPRQNIDGKAERIEFLLNK